MYICVCFFNIDPPCVDEENNKSWVREHRAVLRGIRELKCSHEFRGEYFSQSTYVDSRGKNQPCVFMDRDGFVMLVMTLKQCASKRPIGKNTPLYDTHVAAGASLVRLDGWELLSQYLKGPEAEHLWTHNQCSICDFSHLSRISIARADAMPFLQRVLTSNVTVLELGYAQYGILANKNGSALDEGYLYRFEGGKYLFVGNSAPRERTLAYLREAGTLEWVTIMDDTFRYAAIAVQGPDSERILKVLSGGREITDRKKGSLNILELEGNRVQIARTGYTSGSGCYEAYLQKY